MKKHGKNVSLPSVEQVESERKRNENTRRYMKALRSTVSVLLVVAAVAVLVSTFFIPVIQVSGNSMEPTLTDGDVLVLVKSSRYERGDLCCISWQNKTLLKRVIGVAGDTVNIDKDGNVFVNDKLLDEPYLEVKCRGNCEMEFPYTVPEDSFFVLGDRRTTSIDSRNASIGCIHDDQIIGRVFIKVWPIFDKE